MKIGNQLIGHNKSEAVYQIYKVTSYSHPQCTSVQIFEYDNGKQARIFERGGDGSSCHIDWNNLPVLSTGCGVGPTNTTFTRSISSNWFLTRKDLEDAIRQYEASDLFFCDGVIED